MIKIFGLSGDHLNNVGNREVSLVGHEANDGEDDETGEDAGGAVGEGDEDGVPVAVVGELVVAGEGDQASEAGSKRVENLGGSVSPNLAENKTVNRDHGRYRNPLALIFCNPLIFSAVGLT